MAVALASVMVVTGLVSQASALDESVAPAQVVFANGGRILTIDADGSDRKVIFGKSRNPVNGEYGAANPEVSPDGERLAFVNYREAGDWDYSDIWLANGDGTGAKRILKGTRNTFYGDPTFNPSGELVVAYFREKGQHAVAGLAKVTKAGELGRRILVESQRARRFRDWQYIRDARFSPDGSKVLYGLTEGGFPDAYTSQLRILDRKTGKSRLLVKKALDGAWSPDGSRIVYTALTWDEDFEVCGNDSAVCQDGGRLRIVSADGTRARPLVGTGGDQRSPDWSADGRIVFQSAGNARNAAEAYENFSVKPDGKCLTMLTNGVPASTNPFWIDPGNTAGKSDTSPGDCGSRPDLVSEIAKPAPKGQMSDMFWTGRRAGSMLYTGIFHDGGSPYLVYLDCSEQHAEDCGTGYYILQAPLCAAGSDLPSAVGGKPRRIQRGVPVFTFTAEEAGPITYLLSGRFVILIFGGSKGGVKEVNALRALSESKAEGDLPAPQFPAAGIHRMKQVQKAFKATGSVRKVSNRLGLSVSVVRANLQLARNIKRYGDYGIADCGGPN